MNKVLSNIYAPGEFPEPNLVIPGNYLEFNGSGAIPTMTFKLPVGKTVYVNMGDGSAIKTVNGNDAVGVNVTHTYATAEVWTVTFTGDLDTITYFVWQVSASIQGNINCFETWTALVYLYLHDTSITDDIIGLSGLVSLVYLYLYNTLVLGDIANLSGMVNLSILSLQNSSINTYTQGTLPDWDLCVISIQDLGLSQQEVDDFVGDLDNSSTASIKTLNIGGTNAAPSAAGLASIASLVGKGWTVIHS